MAPSNGAQRWPQGLTGRTRTGGGDRVPRAARHVVRSLDPRLVCTVH